MKSTLTSIKTATALSSFRGGFILVILTVAGAMLLPEAHAVNPPPDGGYPGFNTAEGQNALLSLDTSTGFANTAVGAFRSRAPWTPVSIQVSVRGRFLSIPVTKIPPLALPRFYSILPAKITPPLEWTPF